MAELISSRKDPSLLLHAIHRKEEFLRVEPRGANISSESMALQVRAIAAKRGVRIALHKHRSHERVTTATQESLVVIAGSVRATYFDIDGTRLSAADLHPGDCSVTFAGAHEYEILEDGTQCYEHRNGPYIGNEKELMEQPRAQIRTDAREEKHV